MNKKIVLSLLFLISAASFVLANETQVITLKDGSQIKGELVAVGGGVYTIHTAAMGDVKVNVSQVASISNAAAMPAPAASADNNFDQKVQAAQHRLMSDPQMMMQIQEMIKDPEMMQLLTDPSVSQAVMSRDLKALQSNPKAQQLINNPKMRGLMEQMKSGSSSQ